MALALLRLELDIESSDGRGVEQLWAEVGQGPGGSARWTLRAETVAEGGGPGRPIVSHAFAWSGAALAEMGSLLHAGRKERIRIRRASMRPGLLNGNSWRDEEIAGILRTCARHRDLHGALDIAATAGILIEGDAESLRILLPDADWEASIQPLQPAGTEAPEVEIVVLRGEPLATDLSTGRHAGSAVASAVAALALERRALARLAGGAEGDTALPQAAFAWPVLDTLGAREVVVRASEIVEVLEGSGHQGMAPARLEMARRALEEGGPGLLRAAEVFAQMGAWASPRDERRVAYAAFARRLRALSVGEGGPEISGSRGIMR